MSDICQTRKGGEIDNTQKIFKKFTTVCHDDEHVIFYSHDEVTLFRRYHIVMMT